MDLNTVEAVIPADAGALDGWADGDAWLAGGTWLFSEPQPRLRRLIDLTAFDWPALTVSDDGLEIAATCTLAQLAAWPGRAGWPAASLIGRCCRSLLGSFKVWNAATVGGNLCLALPAGPMTSLAAALDAVLTLWAPGGGVRTVRATEFVSAPGQTALDRGELLRSVTLPAAALVDTAAFRQLSLSPLGRSAVVVIGRRSPHTGAVVITVTASVPRPVQLRFAEMPSGDELRDALAAAVPAYHDDPHGDPAWREHLSLMYAEEVRQELEELA